LNDLAFGLVDLYQRSFTQGMGHGQCSPQRNTASELAALAGKPCPGKMVASVQLDGVSLASIV